MSHIMEKTLASIPKLLTQSLIGGGGGGAGNIKMPQRQAPPLEVQNFMKNIHRARSKSHEAQIVNSELSSIQQKLKQLDLGSKPSVARACFTKVLFCHLLGYDVHFIGIETIKFANQGRGFDKRLGYLLSCLLLGPHSEITLLMMSTILKDIKSPNMMDNCVALRVAGEMVVTNDTISLFLPDVIARFKHQHDLVREKAIHCFTSFYHNCPELLHSDLDKLNVFLSSRDPGVLMAVMNMFVTLTSENPSRFIGLGSSFLHILDQINNRGFGSNYYYQMTPLPWLQISLLKVLACIGHIDSQLSSRICPLLKNLIEKTKVSVPVSLAVLVECIITATKIHPNEALLQLCSRCISKLLASDSNEDMRYQGLGLLIALSRIKQSFVSQHQVAIVECLTNDDAAIQSRTTLLLHAMANRANVKAICSKLFEQLANTTEVSFKQDILIMITDLAEKLSPNIDWYISTHLTVLSHELPQTVQDRIVDLVLRKVKIISRSQHLIDTMSISNLIETLFAVLGKKNYSLAEFSLAIQLFGTVAPILPEDFSTDRFLNIVSECLGDSNEKDAMMCHSNMGAMYSPDYFDDKNDSDFLSTKNTIRLKVQCVMTVTKMLLFDNIEPSTIVQWLASIDYKTTIQNSFLQNDLQELEDLANNPNDLKIKSSIILMGESEIDFSLSFLDSLVLDDLLNGNECYKPSHLRKVNTSIHQLHDSPSSSIAVVDGEEKGFEFNSPGMTDSQTSQTKKTFSNKWRDDDVLNEDGWNVANVSDSSDKFVLIDSDDKHTQEVNKLKKASEDLFAGLDESNFESDHLTGCSMAHTSLSSKENKHIKNIWDDDDDDVEVDHSKSHGIFNVGSIEINPFGISKKSKSKPAKWTHDFATDETDKADIGIPVKPLGTLSHTKNNDEEEFQDSMYALSSEQPRDSSTHHYSESLFSDDPWSSHKESLSSVPEMLATTMYSDAPAIDSGSQSLAGSAVDALTDSDPETPDS